MRALTAKHVELTKLLIERGVDITPVNKVSTSVPLVYCYHFLH